MVSHLRKNNDTSLSIWFKRFLVTLFIVLLVFSLFKGASCSQDSHGGMKKDGLNERVSQLSEWSNRRPIIKVNTEKFRHYVKAQPRNYSVIVMLTALAPSRQCQVCKAAHDEFTIVANSWRYAQANVNKLFFVMVDFDEGSDVFKLLKQNTAPVFIHFPPKGSPKKADYMDISRLGFSAETLAKWIQERSDIQIRVFRPPNYTGTMLLALFMSMGAAILYFKRNSLDFIHSRTIWGIISLTVIFGMLSGQMWNHIRGPPMLHANSQTGQFVFIYPSGDFQFVAETFIVMFLYVAVVGGILLINEASTTTDSGKRKVMALGGLAIFTVFFSFVISIFRGKYQGYPYSFLLK